MSALGELLILFIASQPERKCNIPNNESAGQHQQSDFHRPISIQAQTAVIRQFCLTFCRVVCANYTLASNNNNLNAFRSFFPSSFGRYTSRMKISKLSERCSGGGSRTSTNFWAAHRKNEHGVERRKIIIFINEIGTRCMV